jgi:spermidine/putrescine-binding protein
MAESRILPSRTSSDSNSSADCNELSAEALDKAGSEQITQLTAEASPASTDLFLMERASDGELRKVQFQNIGGSGGAAPFRFLVNGNAYVDTLIQYTIADTAGTISRVRAYAQTAPTGADLQIDVNKNGTTVFSSTFAISAGANSATSTSIAAAGTFAIGDRISIDIDQIGSTVAGAKVAIVVEWS